MIKLKKQNIIARHLKFSIPDDLNSEVINGECEISYFVIGISMLLPYLEPYAIKHMLSAQKMISDQDLLYDIRQFNLQEGQHYRQHELFNKKIREKYPDIVKLEKKLKDDINRFSDKSLKFNLAYIESFEAMTGPLINFMLKSGIISKMSDPLSDMWKWHFLEEIEHRTVAYDTYYKLYPNGFLFRCQVGIISQSHILFSILSFAKIMLKIERDQFKNRGGWSGRIVRVSKWSWFALKLFFPSLLCTYLSNHNPRNINVPQELFELTEYYNSRAIKLLT